MRAITKNYFSYCGRKGKGKTVYCEIGKKFPEKSLQFKRARFRTGEEGKKKRLGTLSWESSVPGLRKKGIRTDDTGGGREGDYNSDNCLERREKGEVGLIGQEERLYRKEKKIEVSARAKRKAVNRKTKIRCNFIVKEKNKRAEYKREKGRGKKERAFGEKRPGSRGGGKRKISLNKIQNILLNFQKEKRRGGGGKTIRPLNTGM